MKINTRYSNHPEDAKYYTTDDIREHYLVNDLFIPDELNFTYSHYDRIMVAGIKPVEKALTLEAGKEMGVAYFLERREMGVINVGGDGVITLDGKDFTIKSNDGIYIGTGTKEVTFKSTDKSNLAKFYVNSAPSHYQHPTTQIKFTDAKKVELGAQATLNKRTIYQYVHPAVCKSSQLVMGMTLLEPNNVWNTFPCHTHERRMEVYFYFNMEPSTRVFHLMGEPSETRHIIMENEQAVISPSWSIHSGVGTSNYTFIWGMCGENITFTDMDHVAVEDMK